MRWNCNVDCVVMNVVFTRVHFATAKRAMELQNKRRNAPAKMVEIAVQSAWAKVAFTIQSTLKSAQISLLTQERTTRLCIIVVGSDPENFSDMGESFSSRLMQNVDDVCTSGAGHTANTLWNAHLVIDTCNIATNVTASLRKHADGAKARDIAKICVMRLIAYAVLFSEQNDFFFGFSCVWTIDKTKSFPRFEVLHNRRSRKLAEVQDDFHHMLEKGIEIPSVNPMAQWWV